MLIAVPSHSQCMFDRIGLFGPALVPCFTAVWRWNSRKYIVLRSKFANELWKHVFLPCYSFNSYSTRESIIKFRCQLASVSNCWWNVSELETIYWTVLKFCVVLQKLSRNARKHEMNAGIVCPREYFWSAEGMFSTKNDLQYHMASSINYVTLIIDLLINSCFFLSPDVELFHSEIVWEVLRWQVAPSTSSNSVKQRMTHGQHKSHVCSA